MAPNTNTLSNTTEVKTGEKEQSLHHHVIGLVNHVARSEEYRKLRSNKIPHTEAFSGAIDAIVKSPDNGFSSFDTALLTVTAHLGIYTEAEEELEILKEAQHQNKGWLPPEDYERNKELKRKYVIPFNHELKSLINEGPNVKMNELTRALTQVHTAVFSQHNSLHPKQEKKADHISKPSAVHYRLEQVVNGMRHEIAAETLLTAAGVKFDYNISVEEDARGIDIVAYLDGNREPFDIKSSYVAENRSRDAHADARAVWTELGPEDFTGMKGNVPGALSIPFSTAVERADSFVDRIRTILAYSNAQ